MGKVVNMVFNVDSLFRGPGTYVNEHQLNKLKKAVIPMQYDGMNAVEVLEEVTKTLRSRVGRAETVLRQTQSNISDMKNTIHNIEEFLEDQRENNRSKIDPQKCLHMNKILTTEEGKAEVMNCADCGLMLSYKRI